MMSRPTFTCMILMAMVLTYVQSHWSMMEGMWRAQIDLLPVFAAFAALHGGLGPIIGLALIAGSWLDVLSANPLGTSLVSLFLTALILHRLHEVLLKGQLAAQFFVCLAAGAFGPTISCLFLWGMSMQPLVGWGTLWQIVVNAMALTTICHKVPQPTKGCMLIPQRKRQDIVGPNAPAARQTKN